MTKILDDPQLQKEMIAYVEDHPMVSWENVAKKFGVSFNTLRRARKSGQFGSALTRARLEARSDTIDSVGEIALNKLKAELDKGEIQPNSINALGQLLGRLYNEFRQRQEVKQDVTTHTPLSDETMAKIADAWEGETDATEG